MKPNASMQARLEPISGCLLFVVGSQTAKRKEERDTGEGVEACLSLWEALVLAFPMIFSAPCHDPPESSDHASVYAVRRC